MPDQVREVAELSLQSGDPDTAIGALVYLLTRFCAAGDQEMCGLIARHLEFLSRHPEVAGVIRDVCGSLFIDWRDAAECRLCAAPNASRTLH